MTTYTTIRMRVTRSEAQYLGECLEYPVMTHGKSLEELAANMETAINLFLAEEDREDCCPEDEAVVAVRIALADPPGPGSPCA